MLSHCGDRRVHVENLPGAIIYLQMSYTVSRWVVSYPYTYPVTVTDIWMLNNRIQTARQALEKLFGSHQVWRDCPSETIEVIM